MVFGSDLQRVTTTPSGCGLARPGVAIFRFWGKTEVDEIEPYRQALDLAAGQPSGFGVLTVIDEDAEVPTRDVRSAISRMYSAYLGSMFAWGGCILGSGMGATSKRTFMRIILTMAGVRCAWAVESTPAKATAWLGERISEAMQQPVDAAAWCRLLEQARSGAPAGSIRSA